MVDEIRPPSWRETCDRLPNWLRWLAPLVYLGSWFFYLMKASIVRPFRAVGLRLDRSAETIEGWSLAKFIKAIEPAAILIAILAFAIELGDRTEERATRAWQLLTTAAPGNSGKIQALQHLNAQDYLFWPDIIVSPPPIGHVKWWREEPFWWPEEPVWWPLSKQRTPLTGIDLTPPALAETEEWKGVPRDDRKLPPDHCPAETYLRGVALPGAELRTAELPCADLVGADLRGARLFWAELGGANLTEAELSGADLGAAHLSRATLEEADLRGVRLRSARLRRANVREANLQGADLSWATLEGADLSRADLQGANLSDASLQRAKLRKADLTGANLRRADLSGANLSDANLREVRNLRQPQLDSACADQGRPPTHLPPGLHWRSKLCPKKK